MHKKDVLFLCQFFYPEYISSATLPFDTAKTLVNSGKSVGVLCGYPKEYSDTKNVPLKEIYEGMEIQRVKYLQLARGNAIGRLINYFSFTISILFKIHKFRNYKTVIVYSNPPVLTVITALANVLFGIKIVFVSYDLYPEIALKTKSIKPESLIHKIMNFINKVTFSRFTKIIALSYEMKDFILNNRNIVNENQIEVIPNWYENNEINIDSFKKSRANPKFKEFIDKEKLIISYFGNMGIAQDMDTILETIKDNCNNEKYHFLIAGHGNKKAKLEEIIKINKLKNVTLYDFLKGDDYQDALNISDALIVSLEEGLDGLCVPSKTYGYYSAGKPIIAILDEKMDISKEIEKYKNGFIIPNRGIILFNNALKILENKAIRLKMGNQSRKLFEERYTKEKLTINYVTMIDKILEDE